MPDDAGTGTPWEAEVERALQVNGQVRDLVRHTDPPGFTFTTGPEEAPRTWAVGLFLEPQRLRPGGVGLKLMPYVQLLERKSADALLLVTLNGLSPQDQAGVSAVPYDIRNCTVQQLKLGEFDLGTYAPRPESKTGARSDRSAGAALQQMRGDEFFEREAVRALSARFGKAELRPAGRRGPDATFNTGPDGLGQHWAVALIPSSRGYLQEELDDMLRKYGLMLINQRADGVLVVAEGTLPPQLPPQSSGGPLNMRYCTLGELKAGRVDLTDAPERANAPLPPGAFDAAVRRALERHYADVRHRPNGPGRPPNFMFTEIPDRPGGGPMTWAAMSLWSAGGVQQKRLNTKLSYYSELFRHGGMHGLLVVTSQGLAPGVGLKGWPAGSEIFDIRIATLAELEAGEVKLSLIDEPVEEESSGAARRGRIAAEWRDEDSERTSRGANKKRGLVAQVSGLLGRSYSLKPNGNGFEFSTEPAGGGRRWVVLPVAGGRSPTAGKLEAQLAPYVDGLQSGVLYGVLVVSKQGLPDSIAKTYPTQTLNVHHRTLAQLQAGDFGLEHEHEHEHEGAGSPTVGDDDPGPLGRVISTKLGSKENKDAQASIRELARKIYGENAPVLRAYRNDMLAVQVENVQRSFTVETVRESVLRLYDIPLIRMLAEKVILPLAVKEA